MNENHTILDSGDAAGHLVQEFLGRRQAFVDAYLRQAGLADRELTASWDLVPEAIRVVIPEDPHGYGLSGGFGVGKTFAVAAQCRKEAERVVSSTMEQMIDRVASEDFLLRDAIRLGRLSMRRVTLKWVNWPSDIANYRAGLFLFDQFAE